MIIWLVNHYAVPPDRPGGARHFFLSRELIRRGHQVIVIASSFDHKTRRETRLHSGEEMQDELIEGVLYRWLRTPGYSSNGVARVRNMLSFASKLVRMKSLRGLPEPDVVLGSSPHLWAASAAEKVARRYRVPFVLEIRDIWPQSLVNVASVSPRHPLVWLLSRTERRLYRSAERIVTLLPKAGDHVAANGGDIGRVTWIPNGVSLGSVPSRDVVRDDTRFVVMYAGMHGVANCLDDIIDAAALVNKHEAGSDVKFRFVGDGPEKSRLQQRVVREGLEGIVQFDPPVPKEKVHRTLQQADLLVATMHDTALYRFGISFNKLYDYMAASRPVVFGCRAVNNPVEEAGAGYSVAPGDPIALAEAIIRVRSASDAERKAMGQQGRRFVEANHDYSRLAVLLEGVFTSAIA